MKTITPLFLAVGVLAGPCSPAQDVAPLSATTRDSSFKFRWYVAPQFPARLGWQGVTVGEVQITFELDDKGTLNDWLVTAYTHQAFADATVAALQSWIFEPARRDGKPVASVGQITMNFERNNASLASNPAKVEDRPGRNFVYQPCEPRRLDRIPRAIRVVEPFYPRQYYVDGATGSVTLEFYVDEAGRVRVPVVTDASQDYLAATAVAAVKEWRFEPPLSRGKPVLVRVSQDFTFAPDPGK